MPGFSITPVAAFPPASSDGFPRFLQWQQDGVDVGDTAIETVNVVGGALTVNSGGSVLTIDLSGFTGGIQFQDDGVDVGDVAVDTVNFTGSAVTSVTLSPDNTTLLLQLDASAAVAFAWRDAGGDTTLQAGDANNGIAATNVSGLQTITVPDDSVAFDVGDSVLIVAEGGAGVQIVAVSGVSLRYRSALIAVLAGQYAVATLIKRAANTWYLCGDLESA
jgi:hypothetical protein